MLPSTEAFSNGKSFFLSPLLSQLVLLVFLNLLFSFPCLPFLHYLPVFFFPSFLPFFFYSYIYEVSRRNPFVFAPTLLTAAARFEEMTKTCCEEQEKANCFRTKVGTTFVFLKGQGFIPNCRSLLKIKLQQKSCLPFKNYSLATFTGFSTHWPPATDLNFLLLETLERQLPISRVSLLVLSSL